MNPNRFFVPRMIVNPNMVNNAYLFPKNIGLFQKFSEGIRSFNWTKLLTTTSKTLNIMNQTIPLIKQTKPMINNVRSMINLAKAFRQETKKPNSNKVIKQPIHAPVSEYPTFFV